MTSVHAEVRFLTQSEIRDLNELFRQERDSGMVLDFWQERGDDFLKIYQPHQNAEASFVGAFYDHRLVGVMGTVPTEVYNPFSKVGTSMDTDLFVAPAWRSRLVAGRLLSFMMKNYAAPDKTTPSPLLFGVEHVPGGLGVTERLVKSYPGQLCFPFKTVLHEVFLTLPENELQRQDHAEVKVEKLKALPPAVLSDWLKLYEKSRHDQLFAPRLKAQTLQDLGAIDPDLEILYVVRNGQLSAASTLFDSRQARRYLWSGKPSLPITRLQRLSDRAPLRAGDEFRWGLVGLSVQDGSGSDLRKIFEKSLVCASRRGLQGLIFRDEEPSAVLALTPDQFEFQRRVYVAYRDDFEGRTELEKRMREKNLSIRLESAFL